MMMQRMRRGRSGVKSAHITASAGRLDENGLSALKDVLKANPGTFPVILHLMSDEGEVIIGAGDELRISANEDALLKIKGLNLCRAQGCNNRKETGYDKDN